MSTNEPQATPSNKGVRITPASRAAIAAQVIAGATQTSVASQFGVHPNTVYNIVKDVRENGADPAQLDWRKRLSETLPTKAVSAIERSIDDTEDVHKAANTGVQVLKGLGHLAGDQGATNVTVIVQAIQSLPADIRAMYLSNDDVIEVTPECDKDNTSTLRSVADNDQT